TQSRSRVPAKWKHTLGILLLMVTVVLWTASNFLASTIFADNTYTKPFFVTYVNTAFFTIPLIPMAINRLRQDPGQVKVVLGLLRKRGRGIRYTRLKEHGDDATTPFPPYRENMQSGPSSDTIDDMADSRTLLVAKDSSEASALSLIETAKLSFEFCCLWFLANYFTVACLSYTTVASSTILTSTSSIWTLLCGTLSHVERFTVRKLVGVLASLLGIILISTVDISGQNNSDENRGSFPKKSSREIAIGDALALLSALLYGFYTVLMKKRIGDEARVNMPLFFGLVGLFNVLFLWPGLVLLNATDIEPFALPPTPRIWAIVLVNSSSSLISDFCWAYAMLLTSPLVVTVGLSMTIPLSLVGQMVISGQSSAALYWLGAAVVVGSFVFVNHEEEKEE
ncbi:hypothetical protein K490DRAFT_7335, partial [Saccharata proteae CBS 121410]